MNRIFKGQGTFRLEADQSTGNMPYSMPFTLRAEALAGRKYHERENFELEFSNAEIFANGAKHR